MLPGAPLDDAPVRCGGRESWLLSHCGEGFVLLVFAGQGWAEQGRAPLDALLRLGLPTAAAALLRVVLVQPAGAVPEPGLTCLEDVLGFARQRCGAADGTALLLRPDQHVAARWPSLNALAVAQALARACGQPSVTAHPLASGSPAP